MALDTFIENLFRLTKTKIISLAKTELNNDEKKERLDDYIEEQAYKLLDMLPINFVCKWAIKKYLIPNLSILTQQIYDILKIKIEEL